MSILYPVFNATNAEYEPITFKCKIQDTFVNEKIAKQLDLQQKFSQLFNDASSVTDLEDRITETVNFLGFSDYSFIRLTTLDLPNKKPALKPEVLFSSHKSHNLFLDNHLENNTLASTQKQHISIIYQYIASKHFDIELLNKPSIYLLITSTDYYNHYIAPEGAYKSGAYAAIYNDIDATKLCNFNGINARTLNILVNLIKNIGITQFPSHFETTDRDAHAAITPKALKLLNALAQKNITVARAANQLHMSIDTANKHIAAIKAALTTKTLHGTIVRAIQEGLIFTTND